ncbi:uncharacterized protein [Amphiura filiformis]|uniref:uncharacterized protein n=1 Tax=Amphiura filiformis TaxID=82378 RepID=UPI003B210D96
MDLPNSNHMESPALNARGRARKPNFTNEEIDCLLELVNQSREVLLSNNHKAHGVRTKQVIWQQIAADVTLNGDRLCQRDAIDVRQKWKDLLRAANRDYRAIDAARKNNEEMPVVSPYSNRVILIKTGTPIFNDPCEDNQDIHGASFFTAISLKREPGAIEDGDTSQIPSASGWNHHNHDRGTSNFNNKEIRCLVTLYDKHKMILQDDTNDVASKAQKSDIWRTIAKTISEKGTDRTASECHKKWQKFLYQAKKEEQMEDEKDESGCSFSKSHFTDLILRVNRTEEQVVETCELGDEFWDSLEDTTVGIDDNSMEFTDLIDGEDSVDNVCDVKIESTCITENGDLDGIMESPHENGEGQISGSSSAHIPIANSVQSRPLKMTLSPRTSRPDLLHARKRKRPLSSVSRLNPFQSTRNHNPSPSNPPRPLNHYRERLELENRRLRLEVEKLELENSLIRTQQEKMELEKDKLRCEIEKIEEEKQKVNMDKELVAMNIRVLSQKCHNCDSNIDIKVELD